jgi:3-methyladenine DNA glycosylase AlkD
MNIEEIMQELEALSTPQTKKVYKAHGVREPHFGTPTTAMRPLARKIKRNQILAEQLYSTGNYDAMYFAGMIADPMAMTEADFDRWLSAAYFYMLSDYVVAVTLAESPLAQPIADRWITPGGPELTMSAGWACYEWLLGWRPDESFDPARIRSMIDAVEATIHSSPNRTRYAMNGFLIAAGVSFAPLHEYALNAADAVGKVQCHTGKGSCAVPVAADAIRKAAGAGRTGFKRRAVRC